MRAFPLLVLNGWALFAPCTSEKNRPAKAQTQFQKGLLTWKPRKYPVDQHPVQEACNK